MEAAVDFSHQVVPLLKKHCAECHLGEKKKAGLSMNTRAALLEGSENGPVVVPGKPDEGSFLKVLTSTDPDEQMPPKGARLSAEEIKLLRAWIAEGLPWESGFTFGKPTYEPVLQPRHPTLPEPSNPERKHPIDRIIDSYLKKQGQSVPERASAETLQRRMHLDLIGLLPGEKALTAEEILNQDVAYAEHWLSFWNDLLRNDYVGTGYIDGGRKPITGWLYQALVTNKPYDVFAKELLAPSSESEGFIRGIQWRGNVNASQTREIQFSQSVSQVFLGINMKCASCHDSFIDRWKLDDAYALAAIYAETPQDIYRCDKPTGRKAQAAWIFPEIGKLDASAPQPERLKALSALMTHPKNGRFTRTIANRLWHRLMGRGIVHPVDAMDTEPWSADLLDYLAAYLSDNGYDLKKLLLHITASEAYQSETSTAAEPPDPAHYVYTGPVARRLTAEQFMDAVWTVTKSYPANAHASVLRGKPTPGVEPSAQWIWTQADPQADAKAAIAFRKVITLEGHPTAAAAYITADNSYTLYVNNKEIGTDNNLGTLEIYPIGVPLRKGGNVITVVVKNDGDGKNPAGLLFEARIEYAQSKVVQIASDSTWQWNAELPKQERKAIKPVTKGWQPAAVVAQQGIWASQTADKAKLAAAKITVTNDDPVRASLVISDLLQRALGRPNREQIVSVRPDNLTTLEAIDLANGSVLAGLLEKGAKHLLSAHTAPSDVVESLYQQLLARKPSAAEKTAALELLGAEPTAQNLEDILWAVLLTPEFQFIR
jgi:hypothetical protein